MKKHMNLLEKKNGLIDLHLHTTNSDGMESPDEVIGKAQAAGLSLIAITDHNCFTFTECKMSGQMMIVPGIELSTEYYVPAWKDTTEIHVVGIFPNGVNPEDFEDVFSGIEDGKLDYVKAILEDLKKRKINITLDEVCNVERTCEHVGRHQIAKVLVEKGIESSIDDAFDHQIGNFSPYYIPSTKYVHYVTMETAVKKIIEYGGIPCLAHPYGYSLNEEEIEQLVRNFKQAAGAVAGMEIYYEMYLNDPVRMEFLKKLQIKYDLLASCGSDRHRTDQPFATGGTIELFRVMLNVLLNDNE